MASSDDTLPLTLATFTMSSQIMPYSLSPFFLDVVIILLMAVANDIVFTSLKCVVVKLYLCLISFKHDNSDSYTMPSALIMLVNKTAIAVFVFSSIIKPICCSMFFYLFMTSLSMEVTNFSQIYFIKIRFINQ